MTNFIFIHGNKQEKISSWYAMSISTSIYVTYLAALFYCRKSKWSCRLFEERTLNLQS